jgi:hypothetical protein
MCNFNAHANLYPAQRDVATTDRNASADKGPSNGCVISLPTYLYNG